MRVFSPSFSLFEILLVLSLILVVVTISVSTKAFFNDFFLKGEIDRFCVFYRYLQMRAVAEGKQCVLTFNLQNNSCSCQISKTERIIHKLENGIKFGFIPGILGPPSKPSKVIGKSINLDRQIGIDSSFSDLNAIFYANGKITSGSIYLVDNQNKNMGALTCSPSRVSYLRKYCWQGKKWISV